MATPLVNVNGTVVTVDTYEAHRLRQAKTAERKTPLDPAEVLTAKTVADLVPIVNALVVKCQRLQAELDELKAR